MIATADVDVVDVAQDAAAGPLGDGGDELPFRNSRMPVLQVRGWILDQKLMLQILLCLLDMAADKVECLFRHRQRQQVGEISTTHDAPGKMLRDQARVEA